MDEASSPKDERKDAEPTLSDNLQQQDPTTLSQQQQQIDASQQSSSSSSTIGVATNQTNNQATSTSNTATTTNNKSDLSSMPEDLFSNKRWGTTPIRQDTPWDLPPSPTQPSPAVPSLNSGANSVSVGGIGSTPLAIPPGISQSGQAMAAAVNLVGGTSSSGPSASRYDQPWRPMAAIGSGFQTQGDFARAPGPATSSILDAKPFGGIGQRASTWSSFGTQPGSNDHDTEWPKTTNPGISSGQASSNAFDLVHDFDGGKPWHAGNLMKSLDDDTPLPNLGAASMSTAFPSAYGFSSSSGSSKSPNGGQYESSGIGTWSPVVKSGRSGSMWDGDGSDGRGDNGRFDDGTAIWGNPTSTKATGAEWGFEGGDTNNTNDKPRPGGMNNQSSYRSQQQQSSSASLLMSSNTSPSGQHGRNPNAALNKAASSHNFDQMQQQSNALSSQANQPNRGLGLSPNVPSKQLTTMIQQIQLAVHAGHLNPQILNQPLSAVAMQLLYQLLTQIRSLHQLQMKFNQPGSHQAAFSVQITKTKQNIMNLQNQIAAQQAMHLKQQQQTQAHNISTRQPTIPNLATGGVGSGNLGPALPPGISQSGTSSVSDFHSGQAIVNSFGVDSMSANGLASSLSHMSLGGSGSGQAGMMHSSRYDQPWRAPSNKPHHPAMGSTSSSFANHNLMNAAPGGMQKSMLSSSGSSFGMQQGGGEFARAPGPASSMMDNSLTPKPTFGMTSTSASRTSSTWSAFGNSSSNEPESEWPKSTTTSSGISSSNTTANQSTSNAFDLVPEFEPGKPWRGSMLMRSVEDDPTMTPASMARSLAPQRKIWSDEIL